MLARVASGMSTAVIPRSKNIHATGPLSTTEYTNLIIIRSAPVFNPHGYGLVMYYVFL